MLTRPGNYTAYQRQSTQQGQGREKGGEEGGKKGKKKRSKRKGTQARGSAFIGVEGGGRSLSSLVNFKHKGWSLKHDERKKQVAPRSVIEINHSL